MEWIKRKLWKFDRNSVDYEWKCSVISAKLNERYFCDAAVRRIRDIYMCEMNANFRNSRIASTMKNVVRQMYENVFMKIIINLMMSKWIREKTPNKIQVKHSEALCNGHINLERTLDSSMRSVQTENRIAFATAQFYF